MASLRGDELAERLEAVLHRAPRDSMFVYLQAGRRRCTSEIEEVPGASPLFGLLQQLAEKLIPESRKTELEATRRRIEEAEEAQRIAYLARRELLGSSAYRPSYAVPR